MNCGRIPRNGSVRPKNVIYVESKRNRTHDIYAWVCRSMGLIRQPNRFHIANSNGVNVFQGILDRPQEHFGRINFFAWCPAPMVATQFIIVCDGFASGFFLVF